MLRDYIMGRIERSGLREAVLHAAATKPLFGVCVGMQVLFDGSDEPSGSQPTEQGLQQWPGTVARLEAPVVPHMGWSTVEAPAGTRLFDGVEDERFYFVHSYGAQHWSLEVMRPFREPVLTWCDYGTPFLAAVEIFELDPLMDAIATHVAKKSGKLGTLHV